MLGHSTYEEFARWLHYLMSMVPSHYADTLRPEYHKGKTAQLAVRPNRPQQLMLNMNGTNRDRDHGQQTIIHNRSGFETLGDESQIWDD